MEDNMTYQEKVDFYKEENRRVTIIAFLFWSFVIVCVVGAMLYHFHTLEVCKEKWHRKGIDQAKIMHYDCLPKELKAQIDKYTFEKNERFRLSIQ